MRQKTGFTLIELLAVIVILAIILLIAVPLIANVIEDAKKGAFTSSASLIAKTAENAYLKNQLDENDAPIKIVFENSVMTEGNIDFSGKAPESGMVLVNKKGKVAYALYDGKYCSEKSYIEDRATTTKIDEEDCILEIPVPVVTLLGNATVEVVMGQAYTEAGVTATDENGEATTNITTEITKAGAVVPSVDTSSISTYIIKYIATGEALTGEITRTVNVIDSCGYDLTDARDGKTYSTVRIGTQCWFADDIQYTGNGCLANANNSGTQNGCISNNNATYPAVVYQWGAAMNYTTTDGGQGVCPTGWHVPRDSEWKTMETYLGMSVSDSNLNNDWRLSGTVGKKLKTSAWGGTNSNGFTSLPSGYSANGSMAAGTVGTYVFYWTSTQTSASRAWNRSILDSIDGVNRVADDKFYGFSVRCVMD